MRGTSGRQPSRRGLLAKVDNRDALQEGVRELQTAERQTKNRVLAGGKAIKRDVYVRKYTWNWSAQGEEADDELLRHRVTLI